MALHAAQQDNVFKGRIADRIVIVFHSWLHNVSFFGRGFWYSQLELLQAVGTSDRLFSDPFTFLGYRPTPSTSNLKLECGHS